ncbi:MAG: cytochrome c oxidase subunit II [Actinobacteria bacterium]|nr:cytochrome c oxidase subunit II [Actinomycetota bacterium]
MLVVGSVVWVVVIAVLLRAAVRGRDQDGEPGAWSGQPLVVAGGIVLPVVVLVPLLIVVFRVAEGLSHEPQQDDVRIQVVGEQFWWRVAYNDDAAAVSANEVHVPVGRPVTLELTSVDVIHSFWVPNVAGKTDLIPGETTYLRFEVDRPGVYRGFCAEFCGIQHAGMRLVLVAQPAEEFDDHVRRVAEDAGQPDSLLAAEGQRVFNRVGCADCHAVRGTEAAGVAGPDLTHLASRRTIGAGVVANTRGNLAGWVVNPQGIKPGNHMPPQPVDPEDLEALLAYLEGLE